MSTGGETLYRMTSKKSYFSLIAIFMLVFTLFYPAVTIAENEKVYNERSEDLNESAVNKLSSRLDNQFKDQEKVTFLVKFKERADTEQAVEEVRKTAQQSNLSVRESQYQQHAAVISELKETAALEQQDVLEYLTTIEHTGLATDIHPYFIVNGLAVTATKEVAEKIAAFPEVDKILPNEKRELFTEVEQNEQVKRPQSERVNVEWNIEKVKAPEVWNKGITGKGVVIASIDSGVEWDHPALKEKYRGFDTESDEVDHAYNWFDATDDVAAPYDDIGHGTHTVGTMVGGETDGTNQIGVAPAASWIAVKAFTEDGGTDKDLLAAAEWILAPTDEQGRTRIEMAPDIVNNSWGGGPGLDEWYRDVVKEWRHANIFPEFSAGNVDRNNAGGPGSVASPANYPESFATGATDVRDKVADFSLRGPSPYDEIKPDISAPGQVIRSSIPGGNYAENSGTSMAGPAVSGVAGLLRSVDSSLSVGEMEDILTSTTIPLTDEEYDESPNNGYGYGLVDALNAVSAVGEGVGSLEGTVTNHKGEPLHAEVSVLEQSRSVNTDGADGSYMIQYAAGEYVVEAEAYGYHPIKELVVFEKNATVTQDFSLEPISEYTLHGNLTDEQTGEAIEGATIQLKQDANIVPVKTDEEGEFDLTAYEGEYTLKIAAKDYYGKETEIVIDESTAELNLTLQPFYSFKEDELAYDDGTGEGGSRFHEAGSGWGVRMSLPEGKDRAMVTGGKFLFSKSGGEDFQVEVYDADGSDAGPGERIAGPIDATAVKNGDWTYVDLRDEGIVVEDDFYIVYMQTQDGGDAPLLQQDKSGPFTERSWENYHGNWYPLESNFLTGNKMIRALVEYEVDRPKILSPKNGEMTNENEVTVKGTATPNTKISLIHNDEEVEQVIVEDSGEFSVPIELTQGENELKAISYVGESYAGESDPVTVTLDNQGPVLKIDTPREGDKLNQESVIVEGTADDDNLDYVEVNGQTAKLNQGHFSKRILMENGENKIEVVAKDKAGNVTAKTVTVDVKYNAPQIDNLFPKEDVFINSGESVKIEFDSEPGLKATFVIHMPLTNPFIFLSNPTELPLMETSAGHYEGYWTASQKAYAEGAVIEVRVLDDYGNQTYSRTDGRLFINLE